MRKTWIICVLLALGRAEIIDRVVAVVGSEPITWSDVVKEARLEAYFNGQPPPDPKADQRQALQRLIQQRLIRHEIKLAKLPPPEEAEVKTTLEGLGPVSAKPAAYSLNEQDPADYARRVAEINSFLKQRFRNDDREIDGWLKELRTRIRVTDLTEPQPSPDK